MKKLIGAAMIFLCLGFFSANVAQAGIGLGANVGTGFTVVKDPPSGADKINRTSTNVEIMPFYKFAMVSIDCGILFDLEELHNADRSYTLRPGVRVNIPGIYLRAAAPLILEPEFDYGILLGIGFKIGIGDLVGIFAEADANLYKEPSFDVVPIELRLGVQFGI